MPMPLLTPDVLTVAADVVRDLSIEKMLLERDKKLFEYFQTFVSRSAAPQVFASAGGFVFLACDLQFRKERLRLPASHEPVLHGVTREILASMTWEHDVAARLSSTQPAFHAALRARCSTSKKPEVARLAMTTMFRIVELHTEQPRV